MDRADAHISERLVELAGVQPGSRVLDVAAGYGEPALTAARKAGPEGRVVATDISAEMLAFGRERAAAAGLGNVEFIESDASSLDFPPASFDAAVSRWGIIFEPDAEAAAGRVRGFLEPGARIAIASWGEPDQVPFLSIPMRTTMERLGVPPPPAGTPGPLSRPTPAAIGGLLEGGGFSKVAVEQAEVIFEFDSPERLHRLRQGDLRPDPGDDRAARRRGPGRGLGRDHPGRSGCGGWLEAAEPLERGAARLGNRLASAASYNSGGRPRRAGRTGRLRWVAGDISARPARFSVGRGA